jgi:hypothetical protein
LKGRLNERKGVSTKPAAGQSADLLSVISDSERELEYLSRQELELDTSLQQADQKLRGILRPQSVRTSGELTELIKLKLDMSKARGLEKEIKDLQDMRESKIVEARRLKKVKGRAVSRVGTAAAFKFCEVVRETLKAWSFPLRGAVAFDPDQFDLVLGGPKSWEHGEGTSSPHPCSLYRGINALL